MKAKSVLRKVKPKDSVLKAPTLEHGVWQGLPEMAQKDLEPYKSVRVHFLTQEAYEAFRRLIGADTLRASGGLNTESFWFPPIEPRDWTKFVWKSDK